MKRDAYIDFHWVKDSHEKIHAELENWARWCFNRGGNSASPMFRNVKPSQTWHAVEISVPVNTLSAVKIEKAVGHLPEKHQTAIRWSYVHQGPPMKAARTLAVSLSGLSELVQDGRQMLKNRLHTTMDV